MAPGFNAGLEAFHPASVGDVAWRRAYAGQWRVEPDPRAPDGPPGG